MLKYKLNINSKKNEVIEVKYDSLFLSEDGSEITGVTEPSYGLNEIQTITVVSNENLVCNLSAYDAIQCGYVIYNKLYNIQHFDNVVGILYNDGQYYCVEKDYQKNYRGKETNILSQTHSVLTNPYITINNYEYQLGEWVGDEIKWYESVVIPTKYWVYDEQVTIDNVIYDVIIDTKTQLNNNENYYPYIVLSDMNLNDEDRILYVIDWEYSKRKKKTLFKISKNEKNVIHVNKCFCVKQNEYFDTINVNGDIYRVYSDEYDNKNDFFAVLFQEGKKLLTEWVKVNKSNVIDLYIQDTTIPISLNSTVYVTPIASQTVTLKGKKYNNEIIFTYFNKEYKSDYSKTIQFIEIEGEEYEILNYEIKENENGQIIVKNKPYIIFNNFPLNINVLNNKASFANRFNGVDENEFKINTYHFLTIGNNFYKVYYNSSSQEYYCYVNNMPPFKLQIISKINDNILRCLPFDDLNLSSLFESMYNSIENFICEIKTPIFDVNLISPLSEYVKSYITSNISLFINYNSFVLPIKLESDVALNLHKDYITHNNFFEAETNGLINRIVDMEKDVYYPAYAEQKGNDLIMTLCHQIQIDLHFRSRDLKTWVVNDENNMNETTKYPTNWNLFDNYRYSIDETKYKKFLPILDLKGDNQYYPPSDLLYFLNFTDEDVFYQKQKIGKSFLRLSFYDSKDPKTQNLLYTSTIFMSETQLYQKYINADKTFSTYVSLRDKSSVKENVDLNENIETITLLSENNIVNRISVDTEPCENNKKHSLTFDEEKRLSSSFIIKNRNEAIDSCEGFYLYLFKEYSNGLHERTIYMKVQFNHAGLGKTVNFMQLYKQNGNSKSMLNWSSKYNFDKYKDGCSLNELYEHLYIEIKVKYDFRNKRFCYYLPKWMCEKNSDKHTMRLSLFEVKIKDESK